MVHQKCSYLKLKGQTYYFTRRVPKLTQKHTYIKDHYLGTKN